VPDPGPIARADRRADRRRRPRTCPIRHPTWDPAPEFVLRRTFEESIGLSDLLARGPLLLAFYVFDFGPV